MPEPKLTGPFHEAEPTNPLTLKAATYGNIRVAVYAAISRSQLRRRRCVVDCTDVPDAAFCVAAARLHDLARAHDGRVFANPDDAGGHWTVELHGGAR